MYNVKLHKVLHIFCDLLLGKKKKEKKKEIEDIRWIKFHFAWKLTQTLSAELCVLKVKCEFEPL